MATRQLYWNIEGHYLIYPLFLIAMVFFVYGFYRRYRLWKLGQPENRWQDIGAGIKDVLVYGFGHKRILKEKYPGWMHFFIFWGFVLLAFATVVVALQADAGLNIFHGALYIFIKVTANLFGLLAFLGILMAAWRRYVTRPDRLDNKPDDGFMLGLIFLILLTGFCIEGVRMAAVHDPWAAYGFVGDGIAHLLRGNLSEGTLLGLHRFLWWFHLLLAMVFIGYFPYSKLFHVILGPLNQFFRKRGPIGIPELIDFEDESLETYGKSKLREFSWKTLFNTDACLRCGRCQDNCPAYLSGKHLNPKRVIQDMRIYMEETGSALEEAKKKLAAPAQASGESAAAAEDAAGEAFTEEALGLRALIGEVIPEEDLWACTTCRSCEEQCPIFVEHVDKTIDMRRNLVLMESRFPSEAQLAFRNMENNGNPWGIGWTSRADFLTGLGVPTYEENPEAEILYWPGCSGAFDSRNQKVSAALVKLLQAAGVNFAILGNAEKCCGDSARKLGNEYLFYSLATENIEVMKGYGVKKILTQCPHCFNILRNEYPQFGGEFEVVHHTEFLADLVKSGKLKLNPTPGKTVTYHDSCYLGRYNKIYAEPRTLLREVGFEIKEMAHHHEKSFCCGAGGGRMWLEEKEGERINVMRTDEALAVGIDLVGTACPFCLTMIGDGINARGAEEKVKALDIAEILEQARA
ncbi:Nitrate reductase gamma subunit [Acididesulfobacillus acetoxydans]|uniref:CoB--CoM heterodisulfide reductase iron-sulfur subunit D n=1 Tax=Acididesulfobacillus acetoxydans TaxID=1561005 RepID=A0A8S0WE39_9FIRM|nr:heterodisulfide reductase-related iron-sulfur binding cluster [Acididesulfobacillus acetoxydans]CAA7599832.1 Nitrate reductase gamma subunit [Acididesulfobacillus acetoxydans]CEJ07398.1 CoB--CoM heterodisulfide reductase iron-sulfur subunit D [Acididesulfobacillus acetoxydans]